MSGSTEITPIISNARSLGERMDWEYGEHSGTITFPGEERGPEVIEWFTDCPDNYAEIEEIIIQTASSHE